MAIRDSQAAAQRQAMSQMQVGGGMVHPLAVVEEGADIGRGTMIWRFTHVRSGAVIGSNCILGNCVYIDIDVHIGNGVKIQNCGLLYAGVTLEDEVFVGPNVTFTNDRYPRATSPDWQIVPTHVCHGASIGANATVVCGTVIGHYAMIAAGSVVTKDVAPFRLVRGNPARPAGYVCICGRKLGDNDLDIAQPIRCTCGSVVDLAAARVLRPKK